MSHFQLAHYADGLGGLTPLDTLLPSTGADPFPATFQEYAEIVDVDSYGQPIKLGLPQAHWHWDWLAQPDIEILLEHEGHIYTRTETRRGLIRSFDIYSGYLVVTIGEPILSANGVPLYPQPCAPVDCDLVSLIYVSGKTAPTTYFWP